MSDDKVYKQFWIVDSSQLNNQATRVYNMEPKWLIDAVEWIHVIDYNALESANSEIERLASELINLNIEHQRYKLSKELEAENAELKVDREHLETVNNTWAKRDELLQYEIANLKEEIERLRNGK